MLRTFLDRLVARFMPASLAGADDDTRRRARLAILFSFVIFLCGPGYGAVYLSLGMRVSALGAGVAALAMAATPFVLRRTGSVALAAHLVSLGCWLALALVTAPTGGLAAPAVAWLALVPVTALMLGGMRIGSTWSAISAGTVLVYFVIDTAGLTPASEVPAAWLRELRLVVNVGLVVLIALLARLYESNKNAMLGTIAAARDEARVAHAGARLVLDNVAQGLDVADRDGILRGECSRAVAELLGAHEGATHVWDLFARESPALAAEMQLGWETAFEEILPIDAAIAQMPAERRFRDRILSFEYVPVFDGDVLKQMLVVVSDATSAFEARRSERKMREQLDVFRWVTTDSDYLRSFLEEGATHVENVVSNATSFADQKRSIHTLKGNASVLGLSTLATHCHELEDAIAAGELFELTAEHRTGLAEAWRAAGELVVALLPPSSSPAVNVSVDEYRACMKALATRAPELSQRMLRWSWEPTRVHLDRLGKQGVSLARRLADREVRVVIEDGDVRLPFGEHDAFWSVLTHVLRNAVDHGIESAEERVALGKPQAGTITLRTRTESCSLVVEIGDDGRGIDWDRVRERAASLRLPASTDADLTRALFADGLSTRSEVSEISGRGVGMGAVLTTCRELGGDITVRSELGRGTTFVCRLPLATPLRVIHCRNEAA